MKRNWVFAVMSGLLVSVFSCASTKPACRDSKTGQSPQAFEVRGWQIHDNNIEYAERIIRQAPEFGINHIQFSHNLCHHAHEILDNPAKAAEFERLARMAHERNIRIYVWTHELERVPSEFMNEGKQVNLDDPGLWQWLTNKYTRLFNMIPSVDGIILTFHETEVPVYKNDRVVSRDPAPERIRRLITTIQSVLKPLGKTVYARTFVRQVDELDWVVEGIAGTDPTVAVMTKVEARDWHQYQQNNPAMGRFPGRVQIAELDPAAEYYGKGIVPFYFPDDIKTDLNRARRLGAQGAVARIDRKHYHAFGSANEAGVVVFSRLVNHPSLSVSEIERDFFCTKYGTKACPAVIRAFRRSAEIIPAFYLIKRFYFLNRHSEIPSLAYAQGHILSHSPVRWDPALADTERLLLKPTEDFYKQVMNEKSEAVRLAEASLADIESVSQHLAPQHREELTNWFGRELRCAHLWRHLTAAFFRWRIWSENATEENRQIMESTFRNLESYAQELEQTVGPNEEFASAAKARGFLKAIKQRIEKHR